MTAPSRQFMTAQAALNVFDRFANGNKEWTMRYLRTFVQMVERDSEFGRGFADQIRAEFARISSQYEVRAA